MSASPKKPLSLSSYRDQQFHGTLKEQEERLKSTSTLYIGNLSFFTTEDQIYHLFSKCGDVKRVVMGLDRINKTPCGFCFVEFYVRADAEDAMRYVNQTRLDERVIRCDWDAGFVEGRQYGRGKSGGQVRDEFRADYDAGRGGFGKMVQSRVERTGTEGPPQRRFEGRGKRKWMERDEDGVLEVTDLRQKLRKNTDMRRQFGLDEPEDDNNSGQPGNNPVMQNAENLQPATEETLKSVEEVTAVDAEVNEAPGIEDASLVPEAIPSSDNTNKPEMEWS